MSLVDQARNLMQKVRVVDGNWVIPGHVELTTFFEAVIAALEQLREKDSAMITLLNQNSIMRHELQNAPDTAGELRTLAIAQMAAAFLSIPSMHSNPSKKVDEAIAAAVELLEAVEKRK